MGKEIFDVLIPWHMVYELIQKITPDSTFFNINYYTKFLQLIECYIYGGYNLPSSVDNVQSEEAMRIERFNYFVKHHSTFETYMANINPKWMMLRDRWEGLNGANN